MRRTLLRYVFVLPTLALLVRAQMNNGGDQSKLVLIPRPAPTHFFISGRVVLDDGNPLPERALVGILCSSQKRAQTHTDMQGSFALSLSNDESDGATTSGNVGADESWGGRMARGRSDPDLQGCELEAVLAGFTSEKFQLGRGIAGSGENNIGQVVLHRREQVEGLTISVTSALAPDEAQRAFNKGREQERKNKWDEALSSFERAVQIYPKYAVAWFELGRVQAKKNEGAEARRCWQQSVAADPKFVPPHQMLAQDAAKEGHWQELVEVTRQWLALDAVDSADAWFLNAVGNYSVGDLPTAERSVRQGIEIDQVHRIPKLQYLLGMILIQKQEYAEAAEHMQLYLHLASRPADITEAQKQMAEITRLSKSTGAAGGENKQ
jgi:tetratricopeptide (TPR) repeat protein